MSPADAGPSPTAATAPLVHDTRRWSRTGAPARTAASVAPSPPDPVPDGSARSDAAEETEASEPIDAGPLLRIGSMIRKVLEEVRETPLDDRARVRLRELQGRALEELGAHLGPGLRRELSALDVPLPGDEIPGDMELRIAQAQLVGWLEGLFQGAQMAFAAEQMAARSELEARRHGSPPRETAPGPDGQYL